MLRMSIRLFVLTLLLWTHCAYPNSLVVIDAGSSGSRVHIFSYNHIEKKFQFVDQVSSYKITPGVSIYALGSDSSQINNYAKRILEFIKNKLPRSKQVKTPIYWYSTAGMRIISPHKQQQAYHSIKKYFLTHSKLNLTEIKTIAGYKEGVFMWLSANGNNLSQQRKRTTGILDLGGASTQITYSVPSKMPSNVELTVAASKYTLISRSFLGMGINEFRHQYSNDSNCFYPGYILPNGNKGRGDFNACAKDILPAFVRIKEFRRSVTIPKNTQFSAYDNIEKTMYSKLVSWKKTHFNIQDIEKLGSRICRIPWDNIKGSQFADPKVFAYCLHLAYIKDLLSAYKLQNSYPIKIKKASWTLGAAIFLVNHGRIDVAFS